MNKLINYINKIGLTPDQYQPETYGSNYFKNAKCSYKAIIIYLDYTTYDPRELEAINNKIEKYCNRYNYCIFNTGAIPGIRYYSIMKNADRDEMQIYLSHEQSSVYDCEKIINDYTRTGRRNTHPAELENKLKEVMQQHEQFLLDHLRELKKAC